MERWVAQHQIQRVRRLFGQAITGADAGDASSVPSRLDFDATAPVARLKVGYIAQWMKEGKLHSREDLVSGIENFPATLNKLFSGGNFGKLVLKVADA